MRRRAALWIGLLAACAPAPRPELVDLAERDASIALDIRYAGPDNFVGAPVDGYRAARCLLTEPAARALSGVQRELQARELGLLVFDCYRPQAAVDHFARWARDLDDQRTRARYYPRVEKARLFEEGYIAERSGHSRGSTVDLTLVRAGVPLDMGTPWDFFDPRSHTESDAVTPAQRANRLLLRDAMERGGFANLPEEWWHFTLRDEPHPHWYGRRPVE